MTPIRTPTLLLGLVFSGYLAGLFLTYSFTVMPGLSTVDDRSFVASVQGFERMFSPPPFEYGVNWPVMLSFPGLPLVTAAAFVAHWRLPQMSWLVPALLLVLATHTITFAVHIPLNDGISSAGDPSSIDVTQVRADFQEGRWRSWNLIRCATTVGAFVCFLQALLMHARSTGA